MAESTASAAPAAAPAAQPAAPSTSSPEPAATAAAETPGPKGKDSAGTHDRVVMASRRADGSHAQSEDFEFIGPKDGVKEAARHQLVSAAYAGLDVASDPDWAPSPDDYDGVVKPAQEKADAEVEERHRGAFDDEA